MHTLRKLVHEYLFYVSFMKICPQSDSVTVEIQLAAHSISGPYRPYQLLAHE